MPFEDVFPLAFDDLGKYWASLLRGVTPVDDIILVNVRKPLPRCGTTKLTRADIEDTIFYCRDDNVIMSDGDLLAGVYDSSGDFGVAVLIAEEWAVAIQDQFDEQGTEKALALERVLLHGLLGRQRGPRRPRPRRAHALVRRPRRGDPVVPHLRGAREARRHHPRVRVRERRRLPHRLLPGRVRLRRPRRVTGVIQHRLTAGGSAGRTRQNRRI